MMHLGRALIYAKNVDKMASFYGAILGLNVLEETRTDTWVEFEAGGVKVALHAIPSHIADQIEISSPPAIREETPIKLCFEVNDVELTRKRMESLGVPVVERPWGACDLIDPEGNVVSIYASSDLS